MPATSPGAIARKNARRYDRLLAQRQSAPGWKPRPRLPSNPAHRRALLARRAAKKYNVPFVGCDGEGTSNKGEHDYTLFRIGDRELFAGGRRLTTPELLTFILASPPREKALLVGFAFTYDIANILRDVPMARENPDVASRMERLLSKDIDRFRDPWTWITFDGYPEFGISYLPRHHLKVCYARKVKSRDKAGRPYVKRLSVPNSIRIIEDVFGFFQTSFLKAIRSWDIGAEHWKRIERNKARRSSFKTITSEIRKYNDLECQLLAQMMTALREAAVGAGIKLTQWDGAGRIASYMLKEYGAIKREAMDKKLAKQQGLAVQSHAAYYGGRFEITRVGAIGEPVTECDINSAYPAGLQRCPCHLHGKWKRVGAATLQKLLAKPSALFVAPVAFHHPKSSFLCGLPFRQKSGALCWPRDGRGVYWSPELRSARKLGCQATVEGPGWLYEARCQCEPYAWLKRIYETRKALGKAQKGIVLKLGSNSVYGKRAQRIGWAPWQNAIDAGLATAYTRAALNEAIIAAGPRNVVMLATDALYFTGGARSVKASRPLAPELPGGMGDGLGQWEVKTHKSLFIVQPGVYWPPKSNGWRIKTRGISPKFYEPAVPAFQAAWSRYMRKRRRVFGSSTVDPPAVPVAVTAFIGLQLAMHRKAYDDVCKWLKTKRLISFAWEEKRSHDEIHNGSLVLDAKPGDRDAASICYTPQARQDWADEAFAGRRDDELLFDAMPDVVDLTPPFK